MKALIQKWKNTGLMMKILCGLILAVILALIVPGLPVIPLLGTLFVGALKAIAPILVFVLVMNALAQAKEGIGSRFRTVISLYLISTFIAAFIAVIASFVFPIEIKLAQAEEIVSSTPMGLGDVLTSILTGVVSNPVSAIMNANYISILAWAAVFGLIMKKTASDTTKTFVSDVANMVSKVVQLIISLAPFGIFGLVYDSISSSGLEIFIDYAKLLALLVGCMLFTYFIINPIIVGVLLRKNPYPLVLTCLRKSGLMAFFTRSSAANIPINMKLCEELGLDEDMYSVSIPLGATINMDGAAITITIMSMAAAHTMGISIDFPTAVILSFISTLAACGASGVGGGSLLLIPLACSLFGISNDIAMQVVAVGFIIGVVQDSCETALNSSGDVLFTATADLYDRRKKEMKKLKK